MKRVMDEARDHAGARPQRPGRGTGEGALGEAHRCDVALAKRDEARALRAGAVHGFPPGAHVMPGAPEPEAPRFVVVEIDAVALAAFRFGFGFLFVLPLALRERWPRGRDWLGVSLMGLLFFAVFFVLYNLALAHTTAARGALALSALPLVTMALAAARQPCSEPWYWESP